MSRRSIILLIAALMAFPATAQFESTSEYQAGYKRGRVAGKDFAQNVGSGSEPNFEAMSNLNGIMQQATPSNREAWRQGWVKGAQDDFRGIKPSKRNAARYEALSEAVARPGVKLYSFSEAHEATIVSADPSNDRMVVRYRKTGATEPKSISALSQQWFARKDDPALRK
jgi:hypothetical protein